jgi:hypothetical protein
MNPLSIKDAAIIFGFSSSGFHKCVLDQAAPGHFKNGCGSDKKSPDPKILLIQHTHQQIKTSKSEQELLNIQHQSIGTGFEPILFVGIIHLVVIITR